MAVIVVVGEREKEDGGIGYGVAEENDGGD